MQVLGLLGVIKGPEGDDRFVVLNPDRTFLIVPKEECAPHWIKLAEQAEASTGGQMFGVIIDAEG